MLTAYHFFYTQNFATPQQKNQKISKIIVSICFNYATENYPQNEMQIFLRFKQFFRDGGTILSEQTGCLFLQKNLRALFR